MLIKFLFFGLLVLYLLRCFAWRRFKVDWSLIVAGVTLHAAYFFGWNGVLFLFVAAVVATTAELVSLKTPFNVFGVSYKYDLPNRFFPSRFVLAGVYPIEVTAAWIYLKYLAFFIVSVSFWPLGVSSLTLAFLSAVVLTSFDFIIDPYAVSEGAWSWRKRGIFFGIPWRNFLGWFLVGLVVSLLFRGMQPVAHDLSMTIVALAACAIGPLSLGGKLLKLNTAQGILALLPASTFIVFAFLRALS